MSDTSPNLLIALSTWADRQNENFTTDAFVHLLHHLSIRQPVEARKLLDLLTGNRFPQGDNLSEIKIKAQEHINGSIPDITISYPNFYGIIEVKVDAAHSSEQLARYRDILSSHAGCTCITFLGRYPYPETENQPDQNVRWYEIANRLEAMDIQSMDDVSAYLIEQFLGYLDSVGLVLLKANSEVSSCLRCFHEKYGISITKKELRMKSLSKLEPYPELAPLYNLLFLMEKALKNLKIKAYFGAMEKPNWIGFSLDNMDFFFTIYLKNPEALSFETYNFPFDPTRWGNSADKEAGEYRPDPKMDIRGWRRGLPLDDAFFKASKENQLEIIEKFLQESLAIARRYQRL